MQHTISVPIGVTDAMQPHAQFIIIRLNDKYKAIELTVKTETTLSRLKHFNST